MARSFRLAELFARIDSWTLVAAAALCCLALSAGGVRVARADEAPAALDQSVAPPASADGAAVCEAGARGHALRQAEYENTLEEVKRRLVAEVAQGANRGDSGVITLNARGYNYGPGPAPTGVEAPPGS